MEDLAALSPYTVIVADSERYGDNIVLVKLDEGEGVITWSTPGDETMVFTEQEVNERFNYWEVVARA